MATVAVAYPPPSYHQLAMDPPDKATSPGHPVSAASSSLFSHSELQGLDSFFNHHIQPQSSVVSNVPRLPPSHNYYSGTTIQAKLSSSSSLPSHDTSAEARESRLKSQTDELAGWLSKYQQHPSQRIAPVHQLSQTSPPYQNHHFSSSAPPARYSIPIAESAVSSTSSGSDINQPNTPGQQSFADRDLVSIQSQWHDASHDQQMAIEDAVDSRSEGPPAKKQRRSAAGAATQKRTSAAVPATTATKGKGKGKATASEAAAASVKVPAKGKPKRASTTVARRTSAAKAPTPSIPLEEADVPVASTSAVTPSSELSANGANPKVVLTEEQKRANHIASEQKRRTAIRAAYDELCNVVPSLRAAVQEYEERLTKVHGVQSGKKGVKEPETVAGVLTGGIDVGGEKVDGRAGPKSEAVVLGKTVEYLKDLLDEREELLAKYTELLNNTGEAPPASVPWNRRWSTTQR